MSSQQIAQGMLKRNVHHARRLWLLPVLKRETWNPAKLSSIVRHQGTTVGPGDSRNLKVVGADRRAQAFQVVTYIGMVLSRCIIEWKAAVRPHQSIDLGPIGSRFRAAEAAVIQFAKDYGTNAYVCRLPSAKSRHG